MAPQLAVHAQQLPFNCPLICFSFFDSVGIKDFVKVVSARDGSPLTTASVVHNDNHHPVMYLVGKVISVGLERVADRACARN